MRKICINLLVVTSCVLHLDEVPHALNEYCFFRKKLYHFVSHYKFDFAIAIIIGLNVLFMGLEYYHMPEVRWLKKIFFVNLLKEQLKYFFKNKIFFAKIHIL